MLSGIKLVAYNQPWGALGNQYMLQVKDFLFHFGNLLAKVLSSRTWVKEGRQ